jgi:hypothetical protein
MVRGMRRPLDRVRQSTVLNVRMFSYELQSIRDAAAGENRTVSEYVRAHVLQGISGIVPTKSVSTASVRQEDPPIAVQSSAKERPAAREKKPWKEIKAPAPGKKKLCPHGFAIVSGITACARCN